MQKLGTKFRRLAYKFKHDFFTLNHCVVAGAVLLGIAWTWGSVSSMSRNWELAQEIAERQSELTLLRLEVDTLELENEYYASTEYQELAARRLYNKADDGETLVYLAENSAAAKAKHQDANDTTIVAVNDRSNIEQWRLFLLGF